MLFKLFRVFAQWLLDPGHPKPRRARVRRRRNTIHNIQQPGSIKKRRRRRTLRRNPKIFTQGIETPHRNPFFNFLKEFRQKQKLLSTTEAAKIASRMWTSMTEEQKKPYRVLASIAPVYCKLRKRYSSEVELRSKKKSKK